MADVQVWCNSPQSLYDELEELEKALDAEVEKLQGTAVSMKMTTTATSPKLPPPPPPLPYDSPPDSPPQDDQASVQSQQMLGDSMKSGMLPYQGSTLPYQRADTLPYQRADTLPYQRDTLPYQRADTLPYQRDTYDADPLAYHKGTLPRQRLETASNSAFTKYRNTLGSDGRERVYSDGGVMRGGQITGSRNTISPCTALSPPPCPQSRGYSTSLPFLDNYSDFKRTGLTSPALSDSSRTTNASRISLAKRAFYNTHYSDMGWSTHQLNRLMHILTTSTSGKLLSSAAGCLQHLSFNQDAMKKRIREIGAIPVLVRLLQAEEEVCLSALGAIRNLSFGRQNNLNKIAVKDSHGVPLLVQLLKTSENFEIQELLTGVFWNLSSSEQTKPQLIRQALEPLVKHVLIPQSGWKGSQIRHDMSATLDCTTVFRNSTGCLRNLSSAGLEGRQAMRGCYGLVDSLLFTVRSVQGQNDVDNKAVENSVCILRNLSYRLDTEVSPDLQYGQEEDWRSRGLGGGQFKRRDPANQQPPSKKNKNSKKQKETTTLPEHTSGVGLLWQPSVVRVYIDLLLECSNPETLEGAAGALRNLTAPSWEPAQVLREHVRKEKGLSVITSLLRMSNDPIVRSIAVCLRNLALDAKNKDLLAKNAIGDLVRRLPGGEGAEGITDLTVGAILSALLEICQHSPEACKTIRQIGGLTRVVEICRSTEDYSEQCVHAGNRLLAACWQVKELRRALKQEGWHLAMLQRAPPRSDGLEYDESRNQLQGSYGRLQPQPTSPRVQRHLSPHTMGRRDAPGHFTLPHEDFRGQSLPARAQPLSSNYGVADSWV